MAELGNNILGTKGVETEILRLEWKAALDKFEIKYKEGKYELIQKVLYEIRKSESWPPVQVGKSLLPFLVFLKSLLTRVQFSTVLSISL